MPKETINISDTNPDPWGAGPNLAGLNGVVGKRFYGQKDVPGKPGMCRSTLWESSFHSPSKYIGTYELEKKARNHQDLSRFRIITTKTKTAIPVQATKVKDDVQLKRWVLIMYRWAPAGLILGLGIAALIVTLILS